MIAVSGATLGSPGWHGVITAVALMSWVIVARHGLSAAQLSYWSVVLLTAAVLAALSLQYRLWKYRNHSRAQPEEPFQRDFVERAVEGTQDGLWHWTQSIPVMVKQVNHWGNKGQLGNYKSAMHHYDSPPRRVS